MAANPEEYAGWIVNNAHRRGTPEFDTVVQAYQLSKQQKPSPTLPEKIAGSAPVRFAMGAAEPVLGAGQVLANAVGMGDWESPVTGFSYNQMMQRNEQMTEAGRGSDAGTLDVPKLAGNIASPAFGALAKVAPAATTTLGRAASGAAIGGAGAASMPVTSKDDDFWSNKAAQFGMGVLTGGIATPILGKIGDVLAPKISALIDRFSQSRATATAARASLETDKLIDDALREIGETRSSVPSQMLTGIRQQVNEALKSGKKLDAAALFRKQEFEGAGVQPTLGQITRDPTQFANERNLRSADPRLATRFNEQSRVLAERLRNFGVREADESQVAGQSMVSHLAGVDKSMSKQVSEAYKAARASTGRDMEVPVAGLAQDMAKITRDFGSKIPDAVTRRLDEFGVFSGKQQKILDANEAEDILQQLNRLKGSDAATNTALSEIGKAVKKAILSADDQGGAFAAPRNLAKQRFDAHDLVPALKAAAEGDASADKFIGNFILRGETKDVKALAELLKSTSPELHQQARSQFGQELMRAAYGENGAGDKVVRPEMLSKALRQFGTERLKAFFTDSEISQMQRLARVGSYMESIPAASPVNTSNSLTAALPFLDKIPGGNAMAIALRAGAAVGRGVSNARTVNNAVRAQVPSGPADLSPEARKLLAKALAVGGGAAGFGAAAGIQP